MNELYAGVYARNYGFKTIGLRYFNVFGPRQDPSGAYAAVIPKWTNSILENESIFINGDGETSRDFCFVANTVQMNILAATAEDKCKDEIYNVALGDRTSLNQLFQIIKSEIINLEHEYDKEPIYRDFRVGDVLHSLADINKAKLKLGYVEKIKIREGIQHSLQWYSKNKVEA